jgi:DNA-directed RNA polymerase specialized sigma24 family protein
MDREDKNKERKLEAMLSEFQRNARRFLCWIKLWLESVTGRELDIDDVHQKVKVVCWKNNVVEMNNPRAYIKRCYINFVKKHIGNIQRKHGILRPFDYIDDENYNGDKSLNEKPTIQKRMEIVQSLSIAFERLDTDKERELVRMIFWNDAGNEDLYNYFPEKSKEAIRKEKCRVIKKYRKLITEVDNYE